MQHSCRVYSWARCSGASTAEELVARSASIRHLLPQLAQERQSARNAMAEDGCGLRSVGGNAVRRPRRGGRCSSSLRAEARKWILLQLSIAQGHAGNLTPAKDNKSERDDAIVVMMTAVVRHRTCRPYIKGVLQRRLPLSSPVRFPNDGSLDPKCGSPDSPKLRWPAFRLAWQ